MKKKIFYTFLDKKISWIRVYKLQKCLKKFFVMWLSDFSVGNMTFSCADLVVVNSEMHDP